MRMSAIVMPPMERLGYAPTDFRRGKERSASGQTCPDFFQTGLPFGKMQELLAKSREARGA